MKPEVQKVNMISTYQKEQLMTLTMVQEYLKGISHEGFISLKSMIQDYLVFRLEVKNFLTKQFKSICTEKCYQNKLSACCSKEGIITFFADLVINAILSSKDELSQLHDVLRIPNKGFKCVYLGEKGCLWRLKPIVCEMFLCGEAKNKAFTEKPDLKKKWEELKDREKLFKWPDRVVLFDTIEQVFIDAGYFSPLMYLHNSPGLLKIKKDNLLP